MICIFSYNRPEMLMSLLKELHGRDSIVVMDDGSGFDPEPFLDYCDFYRAEHRGKQGFWMQWRDALEILRDSTCKQFIFLPDDAENVQYDRIIQATRGQKRYAINVINAGADRGWTDIPYTPVNLNGITANKMGYVDCAFVCDRKALELLNWQIQPVSTIRFILNPLISSGVGCQLSRRFKQLRVDMYLPVESLARHGKHESMMHPIERKNNPLVSI